MDEIGGGVALSVSNATGGFFMNKNRVIDALLSECQKIFSITLFLMVKFEDGFLNQSIGLPNLMVKILLQLDLLLILLQLLLEYSRLAFPPLTLPYQLKLHAC
jgi:hypothetical protein